MGRTYTDFSQLSKGMFRKSEPVVEVKPIPKEASAGGDDALAYFGLTGREKRESGRAGAVGGCVASGAGAANDATAALEANLEAVRAESAVLSEAKAEAERKVADLERQLADERAARQSAESERDRLRGEVLRLRNELEEVQTAPSAEAAAPVPVQEVRVQGLLKAPAAGEVFDGEVREHVLAALSEAREAAGQSGRERRAKVLEDVLAANAPAGELERRRAELKQIIKDTGSFIDARTIAELEKLGFKCVSGNKHWKLDYADIRITISKTPSDYRSALNTATSIANMCF